MRHHSFPDSYTPNQIIVRMPNWLGDFVMATPILADLRHHWPDVKITAMCQGSLGCVIQEDPHVDKIYSFKRPNDWFDRKKNDEIISTLQQGNFDLGILLTHSFSSAMWFWRGKVKNRLGYSTHCRSLFLNYPIPFPLQKDHQHLVVTYKMLLEPLGIKVSNKTPHLYISDAEKNLAREKLAKIGLSDKDLLIGMNPGAAYGSAKCWLPERFQELSHCLLEFPHVKIVFFGDKGGTSLVNAICSNFPSRVINLAGQTSLRELMALINMCQLFLTNDSGPMHVASALGIPLIALFGSTSDQTTGPYKGGRVIHKRVPCSPCYRRECPIDFRCMKSIQVEEVYKEIIEFI